MRGLAPLTALALAVFLSTLLSLPGCGAGGRDARDIASDLEGTVGASTAERLLRDVDLTRAAITVSVGGEPEQRFADGDQEAFESSLRGAIALHNGARVRVTQQVVDDTGGNTYRLTVTLAVEEHGETQYVPAALDLLRDGRRMLITRVRVMANVTVN
jgi:hypothetical protein